MPVMIWSYGMFSAIRLLTQSYHSCDAPPNLFDGWSTPKALNFVSLLPVQSQKRVAHQAAYAGVFSSSSILVERFVVEGSARNASTSAAVGNVPVRSRLTRRRNSASVQRSEGTSPSFLSFWTT